MNLLGAPAYSRFLLCYSLGVLCIIQESPSGYAHISQQKGDKKKTVCCLTFKTLFKRVRTISIYLPELS